MYNDLRHALRSLLRTPGFTTAAVLTLALGIGANTAIFAVVNAVLLEPLGYPQSDRLVSVVQRHERTGSPEFASLPDYNDWRSESTQFEHMGGAWGVTFNLTAIDEPERLRGALVTASLFPTFATQPVLGRSFTEAEEKDLVVVLSHSFWQRRFAGDRAVIGRRVALNGRPHTVVGVMPAGFAFPESHHRTLDAACARARHEPRLSPVERRRPPQTGCDYRARRRGIDRHCRAIGGRVSGIQQRVGRRRKAAARVSGLVYQTSVVDSRGRSGVRSPDRMCESCEPSVVAGHGSRTGNVDQGGTRCQSRSTDPAVAD